MQAKKKPAISDDGKRQYKARAEVIKAMAHATRLMIVDQLAREPQCVAALTALAGVDMSTVSKHLTVLKAAGIVQDEKRGTQVYYRLRMTCVLSFFECVDNVLEQTALKQLELVRRKAPR
jgi:ArsR family transcriptional regulator